MNSLFKRVTLPLLAVVAAALCAPTRAATASWDLCQADPDTPYGIVEQVECSMSGPNYWQTAVYHNDRLGGGGPAPSANNSVNLYGEGDFYDPSVGSYYRFDMTSGGTYSGTYNCWCICSGMYYEGPKNLCKNLLLLAIKAYGTLLPERLKRCTMEASRTSLALA